VAWNRTHYGLLRKPVSRATALDPLPAWRRLNTRSPLGITPGPCRPGGLWSPGCARERQPPSGRQGFAVLPVLTRSRLRRAAASARVRAARFAALDPLHGANSRVASMGHPTPGRRLCGPNEGRWLFGCCERKGVKGGRRPGPDPRGSRSSAQPRPGEHGEDPPLDALEGAKRSRPMPGLTRPFRAAAGPRYGQRRASFNPHFWPAGGRPGTASKAGPLSVTFSARRARREDVRRGDGEKLIKTRTYESTNRQVWREIPSDPVGITVSLALKIDGL
jgi:hypothetical protein